ncbi:unnamed protein product [Blepharisma stoltei]|uniref:Receptor ligand binding region domain-containing protein n=1 Tax=Blepharisma stoltei TaxID=1481888 RepID=A0AAU9JP21_9CILI|nr:unnamed protein product [Blepharisma stoltei]
MLIKICILFGLAISQFTIVPIIYSKNTSPLLVAYFKSLECSSENKGGCKLNLPFRFTLYEISDLSDIEKIFEYSEFLLIYDAVSSLGMSSLINTYARSLGFLQVIIGYPLGITLQHAFYSDYQLSEYANAALYIAKSYNIKKAIALISSEFAEMNFKNNKGIEIVGQFILPQTATFDYIFWLISKKIKPLGVKWFFFKTNKAISLLIQQALIKADMNKIGFTYVYIQEAAWGAHLEGSILLESKWFHSTGMFNYVDNIMHFGSVVIYSTIMNNQNQGSYSGWIVDSLIKVFSNPATLGYTIWNVQNGNVKAVGIINQKGVQISSPILFPGGIYDIPNNNKIKIPISISGIAYKDNEINWISQLGIILAIDRIRAEGKLLQNFDIQVNNTTDCSYIDDNSTYKCLSEHLDDLGCFHIPRLETSAVLETIKVFKENNISTPIIGVQTSTIMSNSEYYPQYARVSYPNSRTASAAALILSVFGISKCSLLYSDSQWGEDFSREFKNQTDYYGIKILNKNRIVPLGFKSRDKKIIQEIIDLKTRYVILEVQWPDILYVVEAFYDLGMREGDIYLLVGDGMISVSDLDEKLIGSISYTKRKEIMSGLIYISFLAFENQLGLELKNKIELEHGFIYDYMCLFYDAVHVGIHTIDALINWGINYDSSAIQKSVREVVFTGCSGVIRLNKDGNDKLTAILGIYNLLQDNSTWIMNLSGIYDPSQLIVLQIRHPLSWNENGDVPSDIIGDDQKCPFRNILVQSFLSGYFILIIIEIIPIIIGTIFAIKFYNSIFLKQYSNLITVKKENLFDIISYLIILIECLQYMQVGPDFQSFFPKLNNVTRFTTLDIRGFFQKGSITFWNLIEFYEALAFAWFLLFFWKLLKLGKKSDNFFLMTINELSIYFLPIVGEILFLPLNLYLFETFQCTSSIGDSFKDSFNNQDCSTFCWQGEHMYYVIISWLAIIVYMPTSVYFRFTWKNELPFHFQEQPFHCFLKSIVQISLVALVTILNPASENIFLGSCIGSLLLYLIVSIIKKPLTYGRASLWYIIFIACSLWLWCCCGLAKINKMLGIIALIIGWILLAIIGAIYQKYKLPALLKSEKGIDIIKLFRFQFLSISPETAGIAKTSSIKYLYDNELSQIKHIKNNVQKPINSIFSEEDNLRSSIQFLNISHEYLEGEVNSSWCGNDITRK